MKHLPAFLLLLLLAATHPAEGQLFSFVASYLDGETQGMNTLDGLADASATAVSPDGANVYVCSGLGAAGSTDHAIAVFSRNQTTGELTFVEAKFDDSDGGSADGLASCRDVEVSPDGKHVYTAGFTDNKVGIFSRDAMTGALTFLSVVQDGVDASGLAGTQAIAISPDGASVFVVGLTDDTVTAFSRNSTTGALTFQDMAQEGVGGVTGLDRPLDVAVSPDGSHVYTVAGSNANSTGSDAVVAFTWNAAMGDLTFVAAYFEGATQGANTIDGLDRVSSVTVSPDGKNVYASGGLDFSDTPVDGDPVDLDWIAVFSRNAGTGALTWVQAIQHTTFCMLDILLESDTFAVVSPTNETLYATSDAMALTSFARNTTTGTLTFRDAECYFDNLALRINLPRRISVDSTGTSIYVPGQASDAVAAFISDDIFADGFESGNTSAWSATVP